MFVEYTFVLYLSVYLLLLFWKFLFLSYLLTCLSLSKKRKLALVSHVMNANLQSCWELTQDITTMNVTSYKSSQNAE